MVEPVESYEAICAPYVPEQYKNSTRLQGLVSSVLSQCDDLEAAWHELMEALNVMEAVGPSLDFIGTLVGVARNGEDDSMYRVRVLQRVNSAGFPGYAALRKLLQLGAGTDRVGLYPDYPAGLYAVFNGDAVAADRAVSFAGALTSGVMLATGTFLVGEPGDDVGYIVLEENGQPFVVDCIDYTPGADLLTEYDEPILAENSESILVE